MRQYRKIAVAALLIFAAIITPPDIVSQVLIFIPCYALYEYGITIAARIEARRAKEEAKYQAMIAAEKAKAEEEARLKAEQEQKEQQEQKANEQEGEDKQDEPQEPSDEPQEQTDTNVDNGSAEQELPFEDNPHALETILGGGADASYNSDFNGRRNITFGVVEDPEQTSTNDETKA